MKSRLKFAGPAEIAESFPIGRDGTLYSMFFKFASAILVDEDIILTVMDGAEVVYEAAYSPLGLTSLAVQLTGAKVLTGEVVHLDWANTGPVVLTYANILYEKD